MHEQVGALLRYALACAVAVSPGPAAAQADDAAADSARPTDEIANEYRIAGNALVAAHEYEAAIEAYRKGHARDPWPLFLYNIGLARRANGDCRGALESFREFVDASPRASETYRGAAEVQVPNARDHIAELQEVCPRPPLEHRYKLPPYRRPFVLGGVSAGIVAGAVGGVLLWYADRSADRARDVASDGTLDEFDDAVADARSQRRWGIGFAGVGAGLVVTTLVAHWLAPRWMTELRVEADGEQLGASIAGAF